MGKKSKAANTREFFTSGERAKARGEHGTLRLRLGADSQRRFGDCGLCLARAIDPVASPAGLLYCRECILKNLLAQREAVNEARAAVAAEAARGAAAAAAEVDAAAAARVAAFASLGGSVVSTRTVASSATPLAAAAAAAAASAPGAAAVTVPAAAAAAAAVKGGAAAVAAAVAATTERIDSRTVEERRGEVSRTSFWHPASAPAAPVAPPKAAPAGTEDPVAGGPLRLKDLVTVHLKLAAPPSGDDDDTGVAAGAGASAADGATGTGRYACPSCLKAIVYQKAVALRSCGHVLCGTCYTEFVAPAAACCTCSAAVRKGDAIHLAAGGSGYAGHEGTQTVAARYRPINVC